jgi:hypothetical protein
LRVINDRAAFELLRTRALHSALTIARDQIFAQPVS